MQHQADKIIIKGKSATLNNPSLGRQPDGVKKKKQKNGVALGGG